MAATTERAILAAGCFWGIQQLVQRLPGVVSTRVGYSGGDVNHGTHAEAIEIAFDPSSTSFRDLLEFFGREETMKNQDQIQDRERKPMKIRTIIAATCAALASSMAGPSVAQTVTKNFEAAIPNIPGKSVLAVEVDYAPGAASPSHTHAKSAFIYAYVISGAIESKVNDGETRIYRAGESWSEPPGATHSISRNASKTEPAKLLAVFVLDTNDNPLTTTIK
jgi:quercetin dioxygenase-like cupin family protein